MKTFTHFSISAFLFLFLFPLFCLAQNPSGTWTSSSGNSFKVVSTYDGMKYYNLSGGDWVYADYVGGNQYQAYFYEGNTLVEILTYTLLSSNYMQVTYYNGTTYYWTKKGSSSTYTSSTSGSSSSSKIQLYQSEIDRLQRQVRDAKSQLANFQSYSTSSGATRYSTEQTYRNLISTYESQISQYQRAIANLRGY